MVWYETLQAQGVEGIVAKRAAGRTGAVRASGARSGTRRPRT
ncbi:hypothetical protein ACFQ60_00570 [Streptomyces zhihengii]